MKPQAYLVITSEGACMGVHRFEIDATESLIDAADAGSIVPLYMAPQSQAPSAAPPAAYLFDDGEVLLATDMDWPNKRRSGGKPLYAAPVAAQPALKDHEIAQVVNQLRDIAIQFHGAQQLRDQIARVIVPLLQR